MAAIAWTTPTGYAQSATATCAVADTFNSGASDGALLTGASSVTIDMMAAAGQTITAAGKLVCYLKNPITALWSPCPAMDLTGATTGLRGHAFPGFGVSPGEPGERIAYAPSGVTLSAGNLTINIRVSALTPAGNSRIL